MATPNEKLTFSTRIQRNAAEHCSTIMEAIMEYCETTGLEVEVAATLLTDELKEIMTGEANRLNLLKKEKPKKKSKKK